MDNNIFAKTFIEVTIISLILVLTLFMPSKIKAMKTVLKMKEGRDYYKEELVLTQKTQAEDSYFATYHLDYSNGYDFNFQLDKDTYYDTKIGDTITTYTTNHKDYYSNIYDLIVIN